VGADGALVVCPYYNKPTQEGLYQHYKKLAESVSIPIIVYNIQGRTGVNMNTDTLARLSKIKNIVGVKEASGSLRQMADVIAACGDNFTVLSGDDFFTYPLMCLGGHGVISVVSNVAPGEVAAMVDAFNAGDMKKAKAMHFKMMPLVDAMFVETNPAPVKAAVAMMGKIQDEIRLPLVGISDASREKVRKALTNYGLIK
jgi:4-hydroxy-tetrahydrodipicolinate synthase